MATDLKKLFTYWIFNVVFVTFANVCNINTFENFVDLVSYRMTLEDRNMHKVPAAFMSRGNMVQCFQKL